MTTPAQKDVAALLLDSAAEFEAHDPQAGITRNQPAADLCRQIAASLAPSVPAVAVQAEPVGYVKQDELDNMLDDRCCLIAPKPSGYRRVPLYLAAHPKPAAQSEGERRAVQKAEIRFMNLEMDIRRIIGWEKPINEFEVVAELQEYIEQIATQPSPAAPATAEDAVSDEALGKIAYKGFDDYWVEDCAGKDAEAWIASAKAVREALRSGASAQPAEGGAE